MSDEGYLGAYENENEIKVKVNKEIVEEMLNYMAKADGFAGLISLTDEEYQAIQKRLYEQGIVSDFMELVLEEAEAVLNERVGK